ncbi:LysR family transcriptional regulator [Streptococcus equinus]|uniref:LysR family transcriptional regulator n=1 Tax=Streptococcus equinus TaxID=1335 RepID=UPI00094211BA|nr:LysR family transcriptional regulator [Streptococcus equinus]
MLSQIRYFQSVVEEKSFTKAAELHFISQSAISQQIKNLEEKLGVTLLVRKNRGFELTAAGRYFYEKSLALVADFDKLCQETQSIANQQSAKLSIGYLYSYEGSEIQEAISGFASQFPDVELTVKTGTHDQLYDDLRFGRIDLVVNDQRRAFSDDYMNLVLADLPLGLELATFNSLVQSDKVTLHDIVEKTLILVADSQQEETERAYYRDYLGFSNDLHFVANPTDARMLVVGNRGYLPIEVGKGVSFPPTVTYKLLDKQGQRIFRRMCAFWKKDNSGYYVETMVEFLVKAFQDK